MHPQTLPVEAPSFASGYFESALQCPTGQHCSSVKLQCDDARTASPNPPAPASPTRMSQHRQATYIAMSAANDDCGPVDSANIRAQFDGFKPDPQATFNREFHRLTGVSSRLDAQPARCKLGPLRGDPRSNDLRRARSLRGKRLCRSHRTRLDSARCDVVRRGCWYSLYNGAKKIAFMLFFDASHRDLCLDSTLSDIAMLTSDACPMYVEP
jgi:hypothetical protein